MEQITTLLVQFVTAIVVALLGVLLENVRRWVQAKFGESGVRTAEILANSAVMSVEQMTKDSHIKGSEKLDMAKKWFIKVADEQGLKISNELIDGFLESAVKAMNDGWYKETVEINNFSTEEVKFLGK